MYRSLAIVEPASVRQMTTLAAVAGEISGLDPGSPRLPALVDQASGLIASQLGRTLAFERVTETLTFERGDPLPTCIALRRSPLVSIISVTEGGIPIDPAGIDADLEEGLLARRWGRDRTAPWPCPATIVITYDAGWKMPGETGRTLPFELERACIDTAVALFYRSSRGDPMLRSESVEGIGSTSYLDPQPGASAALPPTALAALFPYFRARI